MKHKKKTSAESSFPTITLFFCFSIEFSWSLMRKPEAFFLCFSSFDLSERRRDVISYLSCAGSTLAAGEEGENTKKRVEK